MTARQFVNTVFIHITEWILLKFRFVRVIFNFILEYFIPYFMRFPLPRFWRNRSRLNGVLLGYLLVLLFLFIVQAVWAFKNGMLFIDKSANTKTFLEDYENIVNYVLLCEGYCITGFFFLMQTYSIRTKLRRVGVPISSDDKTSIPGGGYLAVAGIILTAIFFEIGYAMEIHKYASHYWFMQSGPPNIVLSGAGYYYIFVNLLLLIFVIWVGFAHFSLFRVAKDIAVYLKGVLASNNEAELKAWADKEISKKRLTPFAKYMILSKMFIFFILINLLFWKINEPNRGIMYVYGVLFCSVIGIWVFSLPKYAVQVYLFKIRQKAGINSYHDIRDPWMLGLSKLIDVLLFTFVVNYLLGDVLKDLFEKIFS